MITPLCWEILEKKKRSEPTASGQRGWWKGLGGGAVTGGSESRAGPKSSRGGHWPLLHAGAEGSVKNRGKQKVKKDEEKSNGDRTHQLITSQKVHLREESV